MYLLARCALAPHSLTLTPTLRMDHDATDTAEGDPKRIRGAAAVSHAVRTQKAALAAAQTAALTAAAAAPAQTLASAAAENSDTEDEDASPAPRAASPGLGGSAHGGSGAADGRASASSPMPKEGGSPTGNEAGGQRFGGMKAPPHPAEAKRLKDEELKLAKEKAREGELVTQQLWQRLNTVLGEGQVMTAGKYVFTEHQVSCGEVAVSEGAARSMLEWRAPM